MKRWIAIVTLALGCAPAREWVLHQEAHPNPNAAYKWMHIMQEASGRSVDRVGARPTIISREMVIATQPEPVHKSSARMAIDT